MELKVLIIEDEPRDYHRIKKLLEEVNFLEVVETRFGAYPYDQALEYILANQPEILFIDYDLGQGTQKTGEELFKQVNTYKCFAIFLSRLTEAVETQALFTHSKFLKKGLNPFIAPDKLEGALQAAKLHFIEREEVELTYYTYEKETEKLLMPKKRFLCKDIVYVKGEGKAYVFYYHSEGKIIKERGPASGNGVRKVIDKLTSTKYPHYKVPSRNPWILYNEKYFVTLRSSVGLVLDSRFESKDKLEI